MEINVRILQERHYFEQGAKFVGKETDLNDETKLEWPEGVAPPTREEMEAKYQKYLDDVSIAEKASSALSGDITGLIDLLISKGLITDKDLPANLKTAYDIRKALV